MSVISLILASICLVSAALAAAVPAGAEVHAPAAAGNEPIAAESSYGYGSSNSYAPKYGGSSYGGNKYESSYETPYVTGSCYGQYPGVSGNVNYDCKSYSVCQADGRLDILYCPPYTRFNNYLGVCDWHFKVDSYCNPLYKEEYSYNSYDKPASYGHESSYNSYPKAQSYDYKPSYNSYEAPKYEAPKYEAPKYEAPKYNSYNSYDSHSSYGYEAPSYGHRSVYPSSKKY